MTRVLVTHADEPLGRRIVKRLFHDRRVERIVATGEGRPPRAFDRMLAGVPPRLQWAAADLTRHRSASDLFHSALVREARPDAIVYVPRHASAAGARLLGVPARTAEARLVLQHALEGPSVRNLVALGSAFVYRLAPGNANCLREESELDLSPDVDAERRAWIDCDMLFHGEIGNEHLRVVLLRLPAVVGEGGAVHLHPALEGRAGPRLRPLGFDPMCAVITEHDAARAVQAAIHSSARGVFHVQGVEVLPFSVLARWTGRAALPVPGALLRALGAGGPEVRYGFSLDTSRAERELGFRPAYRVGPARAGDGRARLETWPA